MDGITNSSRVSANSQANAARDSRESRGSPESRDSISHLVGTASHSYIVTEYAGYENVAEVCFEKTNGRLSSLDLDSLPKFLYCDSKNNISPNFDGEVGVDDGDGCDEEARDENDEDGGDELAVDENGRNECSEMNNSEENKNGNTQEISNSRHSITEIGNNNYNCNNLPKKHPINSSCTICISEFVPNTEDILISLPPCQHAFHKDCILHWLLKHRGYCPLCSEQVIVENEKRSSELDREEAANRLFGGNHGISIGGDGSNPSSRISNSSGTSRRSNQRGRSSRNSFGNRGNWLARAARNMCFRRRT
mmetsp:Transcript_22127/g.46549  ORF Transcript_22127/g.46549 Transcript_22127/m.46549 type:complete len:308 (-) Transcript_22127:127-1050(-)